ncbi:Fmp23p Ecym_5140 [Eremothecium cymbalariae DBVPG|uniref:Uncharacterized protein n=1 Tax=Eremothecium cymbalariae (strain CBS 270.75 / DBVPG 7215 / KCTC 17166 / NRRL Y-17582) TaxID=931890 RepID=I6NCX5_ERECY|nr:hypothetical protein Ecym_5140 [Eremothecium cymbalariae DBVPG\
MLPLTFRRSLFFTARISSKSLLDRPIMPPAFGVKQSEYKQLPEDSNYIERFYTELDQFRNEFLIPHHKKSYSDFNDSPNDLVFELDKYIELHVIPKYYAGTTISLANKLVVDRFLDFSRGVKTTLRLNGGHTFIFDMLLQSKKVFDDLQKKCPPN